MIRTLKDRVVAAVSNGTRVLNRVIGTPNYEAYLEHLRLAHPGCTPLSHDEFARERMEARYSRPGSRCC